MHSNLLWTRVYLFSFFRYDFEKIKQPSSYTFGKKVAKRCKKMQKVVKILENKNYFCLALFMNLRNVGRLGG